MLPSDSDNFNVNHSVFSRIHQSIWYALKATSIWDAIRRVSKIPPIPYIEYARAKDAKRSRYLMYSALKVWPLFIRWFYFSVEEQWTQFHIRPGRKRQEQLLIMHQKIKPGAYAFALKYVFGSSICCIWRNGFMFTILFFCSVKWSCMFKCERSWMTLPIVPNVHRCIYICHSEFYMESHLSDFPADK